MPNTNIGVQGGCLDVDGGATAAGSLIGWYSCVGTAEQDWTAEANGEIQNPHSGLCLTNPGTGAQLELEGCTGAANQLWLVPGGTTTTTTGPTTTTTAPAGEAPYGGTAAAVPGIVYAANYDTGGQGVAYNVTSVNGTANSYRSDGVDLEATADTQYNTGAGADSMGWTAARRWQDGGVMFSPRPWRVLWPTTRPPPG